MLRWILTIDGFTTQPKIYAPTAEQAAKVFSKEKVVDVKPYNNTDYLQYIDNLKGQSDLGFDWHNFFERAIKNMLKL